MSPTGSRDRSDFEDRKLSDFINIRREDQKLGFIHNRQNNLIYVADSEALELLSNHKSESIGTIASRFPYVFRELGLHL
jgi:hypothetical protein